MLENHGWQYDTQKNPQNPNTKTEASDSSNASEVWCSRAHAHPFPDALQSNSCSFQKAPSSWEAPALTSATDATVEVVRLVGATQSRQKQVQGSIPVSIHNEEKTARKSFSSALNAIF